MQKSAILPCGILGLVHQPSSFFCCSFRFLSCCFHWIMTGEVRPPVVDGVCRTLLLMRFQKDDHFLSFTFTFTTPSFLPPQSFHWLQHTALALRVFFFVIVQENKKHITFFRFVQHNRYRCQGSTTLFVTYLCWNHSDM